MKITVSCWRNQNTLETAVECYKHHIAVHVETGWRHARWVFVSSVP